MWEPNLHPDPAVVNLADVREALKHLPVVVRGYDRDERMLCIVWSMRQEDFARSYRDLENDISLSLKPLHKQMPGAKRFGVFYSSLPIESLTA